MHTSYIIPLLLAFLTLLLTDSSFAAIPHPPRREPVISRPTTTTTTAATQPTTAATGTGVAASLASAGEAVMKTLEEAVDAIVINFGEEREDGDASAVTGAGATETAAAVFSAGTTTVADGTTGVDDKAAAVLSAGTTAGADGTTGVDDKWYQSIEDVLGGSMTISGFDETSAVPFAGFPLSEPSDLSATTATGEEPSTPTPTPTTHDATGKLKRGLRDLLDRARTRRGDTSDDGPGVKPVETTKHEEEGDPLEKRNVFVPVGGDGPAEVPTGNVEGVVFNKRDVGGNGGFVPVGGGPAEVPTDNVEEIVFNKRGPTDGWPNDPAQPIPTFHRERRDAGANPGFIPLAGDGPAEIPPSTDDILL
ncbi:hypothetical protein HK104_010234, partial [Borealophlyctis nickersoniae]